LPRHTIPPGRAGHIFRDAEGHLPDTSANRDLLTNVADDASTTLGTDRFGNVWSARVLPDGTQVWTQTRGDHIVNGRLNRTPRSFDPLAGMSGPPRRGEGR
jgi:filamentous hemagglutinin